MKRPCSQFNRGHGFEPFNEPPDLTKGAGTTMACADLCDEDIGACYCNSTFAHGRIPADPLHPPGTPPQRRGRPIFHFCRRSEPSRWGDIPPESLYGPEGWCEAEQPAFHCQCIADGWGGPTCETPYEQFCPNQCNGHGECQGGFCKCHTGWYGQDCAFRTAGTPWTPGMEEGDRPWLKPHVHTPAARDPQPGQTRKRPLIYVYELPPFYNAVMLQYRVDKNDCVHRIFDEANATRLNDQYLYNPEPGLHEMLLQSEHRTLDPEEADYFYIPVYTSCLIFPILGANDFPFIHGGPAAWRTHAAANLMIEVYHWIRSHHPYWDRHGGRDHLLLSVHDEGSCWVPAVLRPATILSHWGRTNFPHVSGTGYWPDNYTADSQHPVWQPEGHVGKLGDFPCYNPDKDLILPPMMSPHKLQESPLMGAPTRERSILGFFKGRTQQANPAYSRGTRQFLENLTRDEGWWDEHKIWFGEHGPPGESLSYSEFLASSIFCFAMMGDGWAARYEYAVLHGCIPVIIQDDVEMAWHSLLDVPEYSVRIAQKDMARIPEILKAIKPDEIERLQSNLGKVWRRHMWTGYRPYGELARKLLDSRREATQQAEVKSQPAPALDYDPAEDDALATLMQALYARVEERGAHAIELRRGGDSARR
ncbi:exostosin-like glycosyltransferase [Micractinium conductrix]|uniref:Exostosin-like glycosyltransferase n=1 Tax=Micractinium conductrix TaxID=554055 RepID=A0A2P6VPZ8_9CHLO|nr:exostosin-like glycosyltransferase [Micractinium conductrix]|eukprot:PSC76174.1 exostosin-like glycosyltransferase [Micractinium conductrix]